MGVCLRNNRLVFIKAPFILFVGMYFLSSRGWDGSIASSQRLQLLISKAVVGWRRGSVRADVQTLPPEVLRVLRAGPRSGALNRPTYNCEQDNSFCQKLSLWFPVYRRFNFSQNICIYT